MHAAGKLVRERDIDQAMPLQPALSAERFSHNIETEVRFAAGPVAGMALMAVRFIFDLQAFGGEGLLQFFRDHILGAHDLQPYRARSINVNVDGAVFCRLSSLEGFIAVAA